MTKVCNIYLVRHAKAGDRNGYDGDDTLRPLSGKGRRQAAAICERLSQLIVKLPEARLLSSPYTRCIQTLEPLAAERHAVIQTKECLAEGYDREGALELISSLPNGSVLCSHGDVIPDVMAALRRRGAEIIGDPDWRKGTVWVLERENGEITRAAAWPPPDTD